MSIYKYVCLVYLTTTRMQPAMISSTPSHCVSDTLSWKKTMAAIMPKT